MTNLDKTVVCPQCNNEDAYCLYCSGCGRTTQNHADEWHRQNDTTPTMPVDNSCATVTRDAAGNVVSIFVAPVAWKY